MATMYDDNGNRVEIDYDRGNDMTQWETYDRDGNQSGGGQAGGDRVDKIMGEFENAGFKEDGGS